MTHVERSIEVEVPVRTAYDQWTQFEEFPRFMQGVSEVRQVGEALTHWVAEIAGVRREWDAAILEQVPDRKVAWAATTGATNAGAVYFDAVGESTTRVRLTLDYEPEGLVEKIGDVLDVIDRQAVADLDRFKEFIEQRGTATGGWRGQVEEGGVQPGHGAGAVGTAGAVGVAGAGAAGAVGVAGAGAGAAGAGEPAAEVPGDVVAVGPTGGTASTLDTETGPAQNPTLGPGGGPGVGHGGEPALATDEIELPAGDPVAVDPALATDEIELPRGDAVTGGPAVAAGGEGFPAGAPMAVGPTGGTESTLDLETGPPPTIDPDGGAAATTSAGGDLPPGDPVAVDAAVPTDDEAVLPEGETITVDSAGEAVLPVDDATAGTGGAHPAAAGAPEPGPAPHGTRGVAAEGERGVDPEV